MLTLRQQAAINDLTTTTLLLELAEQDTRNIECDHLSRLLPHAAQSLRRQLVRVGLTVHERRHARARARVLCLDVPTGRSYPARIGGDVYRVFLFVDFTLDVTLVEGAHAAAPGVAHADPQVERRWATLTAVNARLADHGLSLGAKDADCASVLLLDADARCLASARIRDDGHVDVLTDDGPVPLTFTWFDGVTGTSDLDCNPATVKRAAAGQFRPH